MNTQKTNTGVSDLTDAFSLRKFSKAKSIAKQIGVHPKTLFRWAEEGRISRFKLNPRIVVFDLSEVAALIKSARV
jgi:hypothetical protein